jgi:hypothetical protein
MTAWKNEKPQKKEKPQMTVLRTEKRKATDERGIRVCCQMICTICTRVQDDDLYHLYEYKSR